MNFYTSFLKVLQAKEKAKETKFKKALEKIQKPPDLSPDTATFTTLLQKVAKPAPEGAKISWFEDECLSETQLAMHKKMVEHKKQLAQTMFYGVNHDESALIGSDASKVWWSATNDPKTWASASDGWTIMSAHKPAMAVSAASSANYTQIFASLSMVDAWKAWNKPQMTREKAIALNDAV